MKSIVEHLASDAVRGQEDKYAQQQQNWDCRLRICRSDVEKQNVHQKRAIKSKSRLNIFVSLNSISKNLIFLLNLNLKKLN